MKRKGQRSEQTPSQLVSDYTIMLENGEIDFIKEDDWQSLIDYFVINNRLSDALEVSQKAIEQHNFSIELHINHARMLLANEFYREAVLFVEEKSYLSPNDPEFILVKAQGMLNLGEEDCCQELISSIKKDADNDLLTDILLTETDLYERAQEFDLMFDALQNILLIHPDNTEALERIWLCTELSGRYEDSILLHQKIIENDSYSFQAWYNLGQAYFSMEQYDQAADAFEYAYLINEDFEFAYRDRGESLLLLTHYELALNCYQEVKERFVPDADLYCKIGQCYAFLEQPELAIDHFSVSLQMGNTTGEVHFHLGVCLVTLEKFIGAEQSLRKAVELEPEREEYHLALADLYFQQENYELASISYQKAVDLAPENYLIWCQYAGFLLLTHGDEAAMEAIDEALFYSDSAELHYLKVVCMLSAGKRQEAIINLMKLMDTYPEHADYVYEVMPDLKDDAEVTAIIAGL
ncbi:MAG TPA: tetratricopeptide repeat protein [Saprospiraceae bacterium]|nr:tetratricopeptide repeat protein [Saprospiraceae bacterium]MCC6687494.1 tetratricopeptide repeat protein [Saprospiraceae bacterium]HMV23831.1 tetratricopeptide repeat protein [Saprospiraceae bacterium]HMW74948.1 tetratricopeptide repeat protein [Saprospiraceae bacterium]HMX81754.1 tetratricopeptide repeat protein [Saprospiraceae bacterium]